MSDPPRWRRALAAQPVEWLSDRVARTGLRSAGCPRAVVEAQALPPAPGAGVADDDFGLRMLHCAVTQQARQQCVQVVRPCKAGNNKRDARPHAWRHAFLPIPIAGVRTRFTHTSAQIPPVAVLVGPVAGQREVHVHVCSGRSRARTQARARAPRAHRKYRNLHCRKKCFQLKTHSDYDTRVSARMCASSSDVRPL